MRELYSTDLTPNAQEYVYGTPRVAVTQEVDGAMGMATQFDATWPNADSLNGDDLYTLLYATAPVPGADLPWQIVNNWNGVHEDDPFGRHIIDLHRQKFAKSWVALAASRRMLLTVMQGGRYGYEIGHDQSIRICDGAANTRELLLTSPERVLPALARKARNNRNEGLEDKAVDAAWQKLEDVFWGSRKATNLLDRLGDLETIWATPYIHFRSHKTLIENLWEALNDDPDGLEKVMNTGIDAAFDTFLANDGKTYYLDATWFATEEGQSLQAHYSQRRIVMPPNLQYGDINFRMELPNGSDEPHQVGVAEISCPKGGFLRNDVINNRDKANVPRVRPVLRWRTDQAGNRRVLGNEALDLSETHIKGLEVVYADTLMGKLAVAARDTEVRRHWPKSFRLGQGSFATSTMRQHQYKTIEVGEAQVPLLVLMSQERVERSPVLKGFEEAATAGS